MASFCFSYPTSQTRPDQQTPAPATATSSIPCRSPYNVPALIMNTQKSIKICATKFEWPRPKGKSTTKHIPSQTQRKQHIPEWSDDLQIGVYECISINELVRSEYYASSHDIHSAILSGNQYL